ncbi:nucleotidyltransferase AbiEii toxin of type IV toxin-antitoxin system [Geothermobacter ehrlichii]|uniref:Nucleotidyltransferase AbiEii toxin of type IV toxin-antitoxin system n=1 Tax=Geothermobacter ehrlichii TaxID=213224 RepID=A0A5D3WNR1_9BACT|nr:nucleotidyl transferase AbiEii/AbiGii toxin family protein [Geothermobacter ehrlichii]TYO99973.1 nucleotidyltransferase AbiEii toxin of type IV toxin-antitoxin system [Geothermobacter ehrlichii]
MIPRAYIDGWRKHAPWSEAAQVEQDLVICRALIEIFSRPLLAKSLAFRGGTALFKLHMPAARYSEDIDLVQVEAGPIGPVMDELRGCLDPWLGNPQRRRNEGRVTLVYRFTSEDDLPLRLKVEINTREHFAIHGFRQFPFAVESLWFSGEAGILTYDLAELLGTKLRALYQRRKGRDLFDLWYAAQNVSPPPDEQQIVDTFLHYMAHGGHQVSRAQFEQNLFGKKEDPQFVGDTGPLLTSDSAWDFNQAFQYVMDHLVSRLPGEPWQGREGQ